MTQKTGRGASLTVGAHRDWLIARCTDQSFTLRGLVAELAERGLRSTTNWFGRLSTKKAQLQEKLWWPPNRIVPTSRGVRHNGAGISTWLTLLAGVHRSDLDQDQYGTVARLGAARAASDRQGAMGSLEHHDVHRCPADRSDRCTLAARWPDHGESFHTYVVRELVPTLKPRDIVIADNLGSHKTKAARTAIRNAGARLVLLPKYSPDLNPIEQMFAKLKHLLRKASARSREAVCDTIAALLDTYTPIECANDFKAAGYGPT